MTGRVVESFFKVGQKFLDVIGIENDLLSQQNLREVSDLIHQKKKVATQYGLLLQEVKGIFPSLKKEEKAGLYDLILTLNERLTENERLLSTSLKSNERILSIIVGSVKKRGGSPSYYTKGGAFRGYSPSLVSLDTKL